MKVLVVGGGSIGKRHIANLSGLNEIESISVYTKNPQLMETIKNNKKVELVNSLGGVNVNFAVIANDTNKHVETALYLAEKGINLFIEKPLSHNLDKIEILTKIVTNMKLKVFVAYNLRFLGAIEYIKKQLADGIIGKPYFARIEVGQYLPSWRPSTDYRLSYSTNKERGGGVALDLSHEIDYMRYFFGDPLSWKAIKTKVSDLEIDSDDLFEGMYFFTGNFVCNVHLDYLQMEKRREIRIVGSKGTIECDLMKQFIKVSINGQETVINDSKMFDVPKTYIDEILHFIKVVRDNEEPAVSLSDGIHVLQLLKDGHV